MLLVPKRPCNYHYIIVIIAQPGTNHSTYSGITKSTPSLWLRLQSYIITSLVLPAQSLRNDKVLETAMEARFLSTAVAENPVMREGRAEVSCLLITESSPVRGCTRQERQLRVPSASSSIVAELLLSRSPTVGLPSLNLDATFRLYLSAIFCFPGLQL